MPFVRIGLIPHRPSYAWFLIQFFLFFVTVFTPSDNCIPLIKEFEVSILCLYIYGRSVWAYTVKPTE